MDNYRSPTLSNQQVYFQHPTFNVNRKYLDSFHQVKLIKLLFYVGECFPAILLDPVPISSNICIKRYTVTSQSFMMQKKRSKKLQ